MDKPLDALVVGAGFGGLYLLYTLRTRGFSAAIHESSPEAGGIWYSSRFPGARTDSRAPLYEFSIPELWKDWVWSERFASAQAIRDYFNYVLVKLDLTKDITFNSKIIAAEFDEETHFWVAKSSNGQTIRARFLLLCTGISSKPYAPLIPGLETFAGICHHAGRWPENTVVVGKRVGLIGTGATGVQIVQNLSPKVSHLTVFQRTPCNAIPMAQAPFPPEVQAQQKKTVYPATFARRRQTAGGFDWDLAAKKTCDATKEERILHFEELWAKGGFQFWLGNYTDLLGSKDMNGIIYSFWRSKVLERVHDTDTQEKLAPAVAAHPFGVRRCPLEDGYYEMFNRSNVSLEDIAKNPISRVSPKGVITADGVEHELDILILATGYDMITGGITQIDVRGTDGRLIRDKWANGVHTFLGLATAEFPNLFWTYGPHGPTALCNGPTCTELQAEWIVDLLEHMRITGRSRVETNYTSEGEWSQLCNDIGAQFLWDEAPHNWYNGTNIPGKVRGQLSFFGGLQAYLASLKGCAEGGYEGFKLSSPAQASEKRSRDSPTEFQVDASRRDSTHVAT